MTRKLAFNAKRQYRTAMSSQPPESAPPSVRERILDVALRHFAERGARATSLRAIARDAGLSLGALQHYFPTKDGLARAVEEHATRPFYERQAPTLAIDDLDVGTFLAQGLATYLAFTREHPHVVALGSRLAADRPDHQWPGEAETNAAILARIAAAQRAGVLREFEPTRLTVLMEAILTGWSAFRRHIARHLPEASAETLDEEFASFAAEVLFEGIRARPAPDDT
ncbi:MAG: helix-turn-helix domain-containing protein [Myxococcota bacterium]